MVEIIVILAFNTSFSLLSIFFSSTFVSLLYNFKSASQMTVCMTTVSTYHSTLFYMNSVDYVDVNVEPTTKV
jgi:hypothetical protein